jgi:hypothetical protein
MKAPVIRISIGTFEADKAEIVERRLLASKASLEAGIRAMRGYLAFYAGIDRRHNAMTNVSVWASLEDAAPLDGFEPMLALASAANPKFAPPWGNAQGEFRIHKLH